MTKRKKSSRQALSAKEYRKLYKQARDAGLVKDKGSAVSYKPTEYSKRRLRELRPYLTEEFGAVRVTPRIARQYKAMFDEGKGSEIRVINNRVILPKSSSQFVALVGGYPTIVQPLLKGTFEEIILPIRWRTIGELEAYIQANPWLDDVAKADDYESFRFAIGEGEPGNRAAPSFLSYQNLQELVRDLYKYDFVDGENPADTEISSFVKLYREREDWKFPEYQQRKKAQRTINQRAARQRWQERRNSLLTDEQRAKIREQRAAAKKRYYEKLKYTNPEKYFAQLDARNEKRRNSPQQKASDAERKRKRRADPEYKKRELEKRKARKGNNGKPK